MPGWLDEAESSFRFDRQGCGPNGAACTCCLRPSGLQQSLEEMEFMRSVGDAERLGRLLERSSLHLESDGGGGGSGYTPLHYAARAGSDACVALLLRARARADATTSGGATPLHRAAHQGHTSVCTLLLDAAASPLAQDAAGETALHKAMGERRAEMVALLLRRGPDAASLRNRRGLTPAELAPAAEPG